MKQQNSKTKENKIMNAPNCLAIIAILNEMARCVNQNIAKVQMTPIAVGAVENSSQSLAGAEKN